MTDGMSESDLDERLLDDPNDETVQSNTTEDEDYAHGKSCNM